MTSSFLNFVNNVDRLGKKKRGRRPIFNAHMFFPTQLENELMRATREEFAKALEKNVQLALRGFYDDVSDLSGDAGGLSEEFKKHVGDIANSVGLSAEQNFSKYSEMLIGQPYFPPAAKSEIFDAWKQNFQQLCVSAESDTKSNISRIVTQAKMQGWNKNQLEKAIRAELPEKTKNRAELIARTEIGKLNSAATLATYKEVGVRYYMWMTTLDGRERDTHKAMNGRICSVDNPDVYYEETPDGLVEHSRGEIGGYEGNPGEDYQCRCSMVAWDPAIDGKYQVKEASSEEQNEPEEARHEPTTSEKLDEANQTISEQQERISALERRNEIMVAANERHAARATDYKDNLLEKRRVDLVKRDLKKRGHDDTYINNIFDIEKNIGVKYTGEMTHEKADTGHANPNFGTNPLCGTNCQSCVVTYELRRRGFDVEARPRTSQTQDSLGKNSRVSWVDASGNMISFQNGRSSKFELLTKFTPKDKMIDTDSATAEDGRYFISLAWKGKRGAHVITAERKNGILTFYDPQCNIEYSVDEFKTYIIKETRPKTTFGIIRVDNAFLNKSINFKDVVMEVPAKATP